MSNLIRGYLMKIEGEVTTGLGKAAYFLSQEFYTREFKKNLGFIPYPGTLNVVVSEQHLDEINEIKNSCENLIKPDEGFGAVKYIEATLNDKVEGAIVFPAKTTHEENYLEFIAEDKLRDELSLEDGDIVFVEF
jgi:riboflavin kinase